MSNKVKYNRLPVGVVVEKFEVKAKTLLNELWNVDMDVDMTYRRNDKEGHKKAVDRKAEIETELNKMGILEDDQFTNYGTAFCTKHDIAMGTWGGVE